MRGSIQIKFLIEARFSNVGLVRGGGPECGAPGAGNFRNFTKSFLSKVQKWHYFSLFYTKSYNPALIFRAFGRKTQIVGNFLRIVMKFTRKIECLTSFAENRAVGNNIILLQQFSNFEGGRSRRSSWLRHWMWLCPGLVFPELALSYLNWHGKFLHVPKNSCKLM